MPVLRSQYPDNLIPENISFSELIFRDFDEYGDRTAIVDAFSGQSYTFKQIKILVKKFGSALMKRGFQKGDVFAIYLPNMPEYLIVFHGVIFLGGIVTSLNPAYTEKEVLYQLRDSKAKFIITIPQLASQAKAAASKAGLKNVYVFGEVEGCESVLPFLTDDGSQYPEHVSVNPKEDLFLLPYSSGTTGLPKGVMLTHYNAISAITMLSQDKFFNAAQKEVAAILGLLPFYHSYGMVVALGLCPLHGVKVVSMPKFDEEMLLKTIQNHKITVAPIVPPIALLLAKHPLVDKYNLSSLTEIACGAAPLGKEIMMALKKRLPSIQILRQGYGLTETSPCAHLSPDDECKPGSVGKLLSNMECKVVDMKTGRVLGVGEDGEICLRGPNIMKGYLNRPEETAKAVDTEGWLHTGDIGHYDADEHFYIVGRIKELIKYNAFQVAPAELEALLLTNPKIADVAVIGIPHPSSGELPKAVVVKRGQITEKEVADFVASKVAPYKKLRGGVEFVDQIPKNPSGKILRKELREREARKLKHKL